MVNAKFPHRDRRRESVPSKTPLPPGLSPHQAKIYERKFDRSLGGLSTN
jgi:hypothetical protein